MCRHMSVIVDCIDKLLALVLNEINDIFSKMNYNQKGGKIIVNSSYYIVYT